jgi:ParB-like chromosome segregation protein Spo0J
VHRIPTDQITERPDNPRNIPDAAVTHVAVSLRRFGWKQPLVIDRDHHLVVGHTRHRAARSLGLPFVPAVIADDLTEAEIDAYRIVDNRTHEFSTWDLPELTRQLDVLSDEFSDVLVLADWEAVLADLEDATAGLADLDLPDGVKDALTGGFQLNVCFHTKEQALAAEQTLIDLPGAFDVRHDFQ